jgi:ketosteroid isomerase-like protein
MRDGPGSDVVCTLPVSISTHMRTLLLRAVLSIALGSVSLSAQMVTASTTALHEAWWTGGRPLDAATLRDTAVASIVRAEREFMDDVARRRLEGWVDHFADSAATFPPGKLVNVGRAPIRKGMAATFADSSVHVAWYPVFATVAASGDLGYTWGYYRWTSRDDKGMPAPPIEGKYLTIWRRDALGHWKVMVDTGNQGPLPPNFFDGVK